MRSYISICMILILAIFLIFFHNQASAQERLPYFSKIPEESLILQVRLTEDMLKKDYYFKILYLSYKKLPIWISFYRKQELKPAIFFSPNQIMLKKANIFAAMGRWRTLERPGDYFITFLYLQGRLPFLHRMIQWPKVSSNKKETLEKDEETLIVDGSIGIAPQKGRNGFKIKYELNSLSDMLHQIEQLKERRVIKVWEERKEQMPKGTRGFDWNAKRRNSQRHKTGDYRAHIKSTLFSDPSIWDHELGNPFEIIE